MNAPTWPLQSQCPAFYGSPTLNGHGLPGPDPKWERDNLVLVALPWEARASWNVALPVHSIRVHKLCAASLARVLVAVWEDCGKAQAEIDRIGLSAIGGGYSWRLMRGGNRLSMHSFGCAVDLDPERNGLGDATPAMDRRVIDAFTAEGWTWGGGWRVKDGMHFQAARVD